MQKKWFAVALISLGMISSALASSVRTKQETRWLNIIYFAGDVTMDEELGVWTEYWCTNLLPEYLRSASDVVTVAFVDCGKKSYLHTFDSEGLTTQTLGPVDSASPKQLRKILRKAHSSYEYKNIALTLISQNGDKKAWLEHGEITQNYFLPDHSASSHMSYVAFSHIIRDFNHWRAPGELKPKLDLFTIYMPHALGYRSLDPVNLIEVLAQKETSRYFIFQQGMSGMYYLTRDLNHQTHQLSQILKLDDSSIRVMVSLMARNGYALPHWAKINIK